MIRAYYIVPRVNPDRAEWARIARSHIRSSTRPYPYDEDPLGGLVAENMDGDGRMLTIAFRSQWPWGVCRRAPPVGSA